MSEENTSSSWCECGSPNMIVYVDRIECYDCNKPHKQPEQPKPMMGSTITDSKGVTWYKKDGDTEWSEL